MRGEDVAVGGVDQRPRRAALSVGGAGRAAAVAGGARSSAAATTAAAAASRSRFLAAVWLEVRRSSPTWSLTGRGPGLAARASTPGCRSARRPSEGVARLDDVVAGLNRRVGRRVRPYSPSGGRGARARSCRPSPNRSSEPAMIAISTIAAVADQRQRGEDSRVQLAARDASRRFHSRPMVGARRLCKAALEAHRATACETAKNSSRSVGRRGGVVGARDRPRRGHDRRRRVRPERRSEGVRDARPGRQRRNRKIESGISSRSRPRCSGSVAPTTAPNPLSPDSPPQPRSARRDELGEPFKERRSPLASRARRPPRGCGSAPGRRPRRRSPRPPRPAARGRRRRAAG